MDSPRHRINGLRLTFQRKRMGADGLRRGQKRRNTIRLQDAMDEAVDELLQSARR
jgi:hypothetical protein